jgi:RNA polymerase sigma factor (sigma-70 family)
MPNSARLVNMKTINSNSKVEMFYDKDKKYTGFAGKVKLYSKYVYIDTRDGTGYGEVIDILNKYVGYLSYKYNLSSLGFTFEDTKQHIIMRILEGIPKYNPNKNMALSTFLHMRIERRLINEIRNSSTDIKNPTVLKTSLFSVICECGRKFMISTTGSEKIEEKQCYGCEQPIGNGKIYSINMPPESLSTAVKVPRIIADEGHRMTIEDVMSPNSFDLPMIFGEKAGTEDLILLKKDFEKWIKSEDSRVKKLIELVCFKDYSIKAAAKEVGISHTGANNKLKRLKRKKIIRDMLGR